MPLGTTITSYIANLFPTDPVAPQVVGDFASHLLPPSPIQPTDLGSSVSAFVQILVQPDVGLGDGWIL